jgi:menaquinone-dependent protoporphyrinogen IX oxidase
MDVRVLVAYATKHGATGEIAEKIGQVLSQEGVPANVPRGPGKRPEPVQRDSAG